MVTHKIIIFHRTFTMSVIRTFSSVDLMKPNQAHLMESSIFINAFVFVSEVEFADLLLLQV